MRENEYKEILSALLGLLNEGVHIVAGQGTSIFYNSVMARMEQMEPADVVGRRFEDAFSHMDLESSTIYRALQAGASTINQPQRYINASGKYIHTINTTIPVKDADGKLLAVIEVANDVTQLSELCDRLAHLQSQVGTQARPCPATCWRGFCSAPPRAGSPERWTGRACLSWPTTVRSCWMS